MERYHRPKIYLFFMVEVISLGVLKIERGWTPVCLIFNTSFFVLVFRCWLWNLEQINPTTIDFSCIPRPGSFLYRSTILLMVSHSLLRRLSATTETADNSNRLTTGQAIKQRLHRQQRELNQCKGQGEYPLFADEQQYKVWGQMPVDILAYSKHKSKITIIENKIGSTFTSGGGDPVTGQLARQIEFLLQSKPKNKYFALLSSKTFFDKHWYCTELNNTLKHKECTEQISSFLIHWEDISLSLGKI